MDRTTYSGWIISPVVNQSYIDSDLLRNECQMILVTYETISKKRYVKQVLCDHGSISKKIGKIIAWRFQPDPYKGE